MGKRPIIDSAALVEARRNGVLVKKMAEQFGCSQSWINKALARAGETDSWDFDPTPLEMESWCKAHVNDLRREHPEMEGARQ